MGLIISTEKDEFKDENDENKSDNDLTIDSFRIEYAKSARSKCKKCDVRILKVNHFFNPCFLRPL